MRKRGCFYSLGRQAARQIVKCTDRGHLANRKAAQGDLEARCGGVRLKRGQRHEAVCRQIGKPILNRFDGAQWSGGVVGTRHKDALPGEQSEHQGDLARLGRELELKQVVFVVHKHMRQRGALERRGLSLRSHGPLERKVGILCMGDGSSAEQPVAKQRREVWKEAHGSGVRIKK